MAFRGVTFSGQNVTPKNDGALYNAHYGDGILEGCSMAISGDDLVIQSGHIIACGRMCQVDGATSVDLSGRTLQTGYIQIILNYDLTQGEGQQWFPTFVESATTTFPALTQEDINTPSGTLYQLQLAVVQISGGNLTSITEHITPSFLIGRELRVNGSEINGYMPNIPFLVDGEMVGNLQSVSGNKDMRFNSYSNGAAFGSLVFSPLVNGLILALNGNGQINFRPKGVFDSTNQVIIDQNGQIIGGHSIVLSEKSTSTALPTNTSTALVPAIAKPSWAKFGIQFGYASITRNTGGTIRMSVNGSTQDAYVPSANGFLMSIAGVTTGSAALFGNPTNGTATCTYAKLEVIWF